MTAMTLEKIRMLFAQEAEQRLARLGQLALDLDPDSLHASADVIVEIFREVHTIKGSAAVSGFEGVGRYAHAVEERLGQLRSGDVKPSAPIVDALLIAIDRLGSLIAETIEAADDIADSEANQHALAQLDAAFESPTLLDASDAVSTAVALPVTADSVAPVVPVVLVLPVMPVLPGMPVLPVLPGMPVLPSGSAPLPKPLRVDNRQGASSMAPPSRESASTVMVPVERLDELVRMVGEAASAHLRVGRIIGEQLGLEASSVPEFGELSKVLNELQERAMRTRMVPVSTITDPLKRAVRDAARALGKNVRWEVRGDETELDRGVLHQLSDALLHLVRNAVDHGIDSAERRAAAGKPAEGTIRLHAMQLGSEVIIAVTDDGDGIDLDRLREHASRLGIDTDALTDDETMQIIFRPGFSTATSVSDISGRGVGLDAVRASVEGARGRVEVRSTKGKGSEFRIVVPITLAVLRCLLVEASGQRFALPLHRIALALADDSDTVLQVEGRRVIRLDGQPVPVCELATVLGTAPTRTGPGTLVVVNGTIGKLAFVVDALLGQRDVVVKGLSKLVPRLGVVAGASVEPDGSILLVLDPPGLLERAKGYTRRTLVDDVDIAAPTAHHGHILVVDDALTVRELQRSILERAGFAVTVACDGIEALQQLDGHVFDLVITDVEMPRMDGFGLTEQIRATPRICNLAVLMLTSRGSDSDRQRGMDAGADGYIVKDAFDEHGLIEAVDRLLGARL